MEYVWFYIIVALVLSIAIGQWSNNKGKGYAFGFFASFFLTPLIGLILVGISDQDKQVLEKRSIDAGENKKCPYCSELIKVEAVKCRFCGSELTAIPVANTVKSRVTTIIECPGCHVKEETMINKLKEVMSISNFSVEYSKFFASYTFECRKCGERFKVESQML